jgi:hypothetical protein
MLSVKGIYENGRVRLLEPVPPRKRKANVIVTLLDEPAEPDKKEDRINLFDDLVGVIDVRKDGSANHDQYLSGSAIQ